MLISQMIPQPMDKLLILIITCLKGIVCFPASFICRYTALRIEGLQTLRSSMQLIRCVEHLIWVDLSSDHWVANRPQYIQLVNCTLLEISDAVLDTAYMQSRNPYLCWKCGCWHLFICNFYTLNIPIHNFLRASSWQWVDLINSENRNNLKVRCLRLKACKVSHTKLLANNPKLHFWDNNHILDA